MRSSVGEIWIWSGLVPKRASKMWENGHPLFLGAVCGLALWVFGWPLVDVSTSSAWNLPALYSAIFSISGIYTAFLFTFYSFIATTDRGFIGKAKDSIYYKRTISFTVSALVLGGILTVLSIPMLLVEPDLQTEAGRVAIVLWVGLTIWASTAFVRAAYLFVIFATSQKS